ncbi:hypothetical protein H9Y04_18680 [Streptomyces sp. TRM66268-LWL]|uniref:DUF4232 domain-containing protein n=2 Tax=Streptomyces polyasparticus TaxID=2767826 RepID=A0ABR7SGG9_9ACTN|nr:hypothetical protein [Streptomyces polyasparticus]
MMRGAVQDIAPSGDALDHLRRAVPARRARKRQALVGMAAAALLIGTAVPAVFHVATSPASDDQFSSANDSSDVPGEGSDEGPGSESGGGGTPSGKDGDKDKGKDGEKDKDKGEEGETATDGATVGTSPSGDVIAGAPVCDASMLTDASATTGAPQSDGKVYGSFKVANQSGAECTLGGSGSVTFAAQGAAQDSKITVVEHTAGDPAAGLPAPSAEPTAILLKPGESYEVQFAWVPSGSCPTTNPSPDPSPTENNADTGGTGDTATGEGMQTQLVTAEETADGSVSITHTAQPGAPAADATIPNACEGTIYKTEAMPAS